LGNAESPPVVSPRFWGCMMTMTKKTPVYTVVPAAESPAAQMQDFQSLLQQLRSGTESEINAALANREIVEPEPELTPEVLARVRSGIAAQKKV
jgi:hypothetical protein